MSQTTSGYSASVSSILGVEQILAYQEVIKELPVADNVIAYAVELVSRTRTHKNTAAAIVKDYISYGAGPRASQYLILGAKTKALMKGKLSPDIEDVKYIAKLVLRHRLVKNYKAEAEGLNTDSIIEQIL